LPLLPLSFYQHLLLPLSPLHFFRHLLCGAELSRPLCRKKTSALCSLLAALLFDVNLLLRQPLFPCYLRPPRPG
jgi:hypothetical protein